MPDPTPDAPAPGWPCTADCGTPIPSRDPDVMHDITDGQAEVLGGKFEVGEYHAGCCPLPECRVVTVDA